MDLAPRQIIGVLSVDGIAVVRFAVPRVTAEEDIEALGDQLYAIVARGERRIVIDFSGLRQLSSAALGKVLALKKKADAARGAVKLSGMNDDLREVFKLTRLDESFAIFDDEDDAIASF